MTLLDAASLLIAESISIDGEAIGFGGVPDTVETGAVGMETYVDGRVTGERYGRTVSQCLPIGAAIRGYIQIVVQHLGAHLAEISAA